MKSLGRSFALFVVVGLISAVANYGIFYILLRSAHWQYQLASATGFVSGMAVGYPLNRSWTFQQKRDHGNFRRLPHYILVYLISLAASLLFLYVLVDLLGLDARLANLFAIGLSTMTNFVGTRFWVFRHA